MPKNEIKTEFGTLIIRNENREYVEFEMAENDPNNEVRVTPREILDDIVKSLGDGLTYYGKFPDIVVLEEGIVEKVPKPLENNPSYDGANEVRYHLNSRGHSNFVHKMRRITGIPLFDPFRFMKAELEDRGDLLKGVYGEEKSRFLKKIKSTLVNEYTETDNRDYNNLGSEAIFEFDQLGTKDTFWRDIGIPQTFRDPSYSGENGQIYKLWKRPDDLIFL